MPDPSPTNTFYFLSNHFPVKTLQTTYFSTYDCGVGSSEILDAGSLTSTNFVFNQGLRTFQPESSLYT